MDLTDIYGKLLRGEAAAEEQAEAASILAKLGTDHNQLLAENNELRGALLKLMELHQAIESKTQKIDALKDEMIDRMSEKLGVSL